MIEMLAKSFRKSAGRLSAYIPAIINEYATFHHNKLWAVHGRRLGTSELSVKDC
jgi:hypothetical protein